MKPAIARVLALFAGLRTLGVIGRRGGRTVVRFTSKAEMDRGEEMLRELFKKTRSYRRFFEDERIDRAFLEGLVENARLASSASNLQPLRYALVDSSGPREQVFRCLKWAGYLPDWPGPSEGERPGAYIIVLHDTEIAQKSEFLWCDVGIACDHIMLSAVESGYGGCCLGAIDAERLRSALELPERYAVLLVLALGKPKENVVLTDLGSYGDIKYYRDAEGKHFVPKRSLGDLIVK